MTIFRFGALGVAVLVALTLLVFATADSGPERTTSHLVGSPAPPINGETFDGVKWNIDDQRGRWVLVNFFSTTCIPCLREHPELVAFAAAHRILDDVRLVSVAFDDTALAVERFFREQGGDWPVLTVATDRIAIDWGVVAVPESYLVTPSGHVAAKLVGGVDRKKLESLLIEASGSGG